MSATAAYTLTRSRRQTTGLSVAFAGVWLFFLMYYARPNDWLPGVGTFPFAKGAAFIAIAGFLGAMSLRGATAVRPITQSAELKGLVLLYAYMWLTLPTAIWPGGTLRLLASEYWKIIVITLLIGASVTSLPRLRKLVLVSVLSMVVLSALAVRSYWLGESTGGRVQGVLGGVFQNPNELALSAVVVLPFCLVFMLLAGRGLRRLFWGACAVAITLGAIVTFSRSGFLALVAALLVAAWEFGFKGRRPLVIALSVLFAVVLTAWSLPTGYGERLQTIFNPELDTTGSAQLRQLLLWKSLSVTLEHPLFGVGPGNFGVVSGVWRGTHNTFTQLSAEAGIPALLLFLWVLRRTFASMTRTRNLAVHNQSVQVWVQGMRTSLIALLIGAFFYHAAFHFFLYFPIGYTVALSRIAQQLSTGPAALPTENATGEQLRHGDKRHRA